MAGIFADTRAGKLTTLFLVKRVESHRRDTESKI